MNLKEIEDKVKELESENKDLKLKLSCHASDCIADYEQIEARVGELEEAIGKHKEDRASFLDLTMYGKDIDYIDEELYAHVKEGKGGH